VRLIALVCMLASGCTCPGAYARASGVPPSVAALLPQARAELILDRKLVGFPQTAKDPCPQVGVVLQVSCAAAASQRCSDVEAALLEPGPLLIKDAAQKDLVHVPLVRRDASRWTSMLDLSNAAGVPLLPGSYQLEVTVARGDTRAVARAYLEVVSCVFY
jgi:hypothetical protein